MSPRTRNVLLALLAVTGGSLAGACASGPKHKPGHEYLKSIQVEGNEKLPDRRLTSGLALQRAKQRGRAPDPYLVQLDEDRIRGEYLRQGFLSIDVNSSVRRNGDAATVVYRVEEGQRARTRITITGIPDEGDLSPAKVRAVLPLTDGEPFDYLKYDLAKPLLIGVARDAGYAHAKLDAKVYADRAHGEANIQLAYDLGPKSTFGPVELSGVEGRLAEAVRARLQFKPGDRYSQAAIAATQRQLYGMSRFSTVQVQPDETEAAVVGVKVGLSEAARREVRLGGGFGVDPTAYEIRARAGYSITGWPFPLDTVTVDLRPAYAYQQDGSGFEPRIRATVRLERQDFLWTYAKGEAEAGYNYLAVEAYTSYGPHARLGFTTPLGTPRVNLGLSWSLERLGFRHVAEQIMPIVDRIGLRDVQRDGAFHQAVTLDLRDHPIEPRLGAYAELRLAEGTEYAGGQMTYLQVVPEVRGYVPVGRVVLAARARGGTFVGDAPPTERFFSGGASNHRGFGERRLAPFERGPDAVDPDKPDEMPKIRSVPYGGTALLETGLEARVPITTWRKIGIGTVAFLDGGDVRDDLSEIDVGALHWAAGLGLRFQTLVGPVRADLGYRLNRTGETEPAAGSRFAFHLSLGEAF
jgi:translocation and assembly module TamA